MPENQTERELKVLIIYWSATGNTEKVADTIQASSHPRGDQAGHQESSRSSGRGTIQL